MNTELPLYKQEKDNTCALACLRMVLATVEDLQRILDEDKFPIAYIDRAVFDLSPAERRTHHLRDAKLHTVIPVRFTTKAVTYHDPLLPSIRRRTIRLFHLAYSRIGGLAVVCASAAAQ